MYNQRCKEIELIAKSLLSIQNRMASLADEVQEDYENLPENVKNSGKELIDAIDTLSYSYNQLENVIKNLEII
jgi:phage-related minor tail protein